jgi:hypothetical protein
MLRVETTKADAEFRQPAGFYQQFLRTASAPPPDRGSHPAFGINPVRCRGGCKLAEGVVRAYSAQASYVRQLLSMGPVKASFSPTRGDTQLEVLPFAFFGAATSR